jgi:hypothetical protein
MTDRAAARFTLLDRLDREAEAFSSALSLEHYLNYSGQKDRFALSPIFERHASLFQRRTVEALKVADRSDPRYGALRRFAVDGYLEQAAKELTEELTHRETTDTVTWRKRELPYRSLPPLIMNEPNPARRHELDRRRVTATAAQNPLRERRWDVLYAQARDLGYESYAALHDEVGGLGLERLQSLMERFLWETEKVYRRRLEPYLASIEVPPALAERSDLSFLFRSPELDRYFTQKGMLPALTATLEGLGIDTKAQNNVHLDTEARPRKSPRAFCSAVRIPQEVYLVISPHGGHDDYRALFHEAGHAQHFAHVDASLPFAHRGLGDNSITEAFAFLLEHLTHSAGWLRPHPLPHAVHAAPLRGQAPLRAGPPRGRRRALLRQALRGPPHRRRGRPLRPRRLPLRRGRRLLLRPLPASLDPGGAAPPPPGGDMGPRVVRGARGGPSPAGALGPGPALHRR